DRRLRTDEPGVPHVHRERLPAALATSGGGAARTPFAGRDAVPAPVGGGGPGLPLLRPDAGANLRATARGVPRPAAPSGWLGAADGRDLPPPAALPRRRPARRPRHRRHDGDRLGQDGVLPVAAAGPARRRVARLAEMSPPEAEPQVVA